MPQQLSAVRVRKLHAHSDVLARYSRESRTWQPRRASSPKSLPRRKRAPTPSRGGRRANVNRDWLFEQLLFIREQCSGATRTNMHGGRDAGRGGPLVRFLMAACDQLFQACKREAAKHDAMRGAVRKLLKERKPQPR